MNRTYRTFFCEGCSWRHLKTHPVLGESHIQHNANRDVATLAASLSYTCWNDWVWRRQAKCKLKKVGYWVPFSNLWGTISQHAGRHFIAWKVADKSEILFDSTLTQACKTMTQQFLWLHSTKSCLVSKILDDSDSTPTRRACDSESTNMTWTHSQLHRIWMLKLSVFGLELDFEMKLLEQMSIWKAQMRLSRVCIMVEIYIILIVYFTKKFIWKTHLTRFTLLLVLRIQRYMWGNHVATWA